MKGIVFDIQRFSVYDGPGIRTTVFLKGCNMRCPWCHNPESLCKEPQLMFYEEKCISCGACAEVCPMHVHRIDIGENGELCHTLDRSACTACGRCAAVCPCEALAITGRIMESSEVLAEVVKDRRYYRDGGGVTFSGGEATMQPDFLMEMLTMCRNEKIGTAIETNGAVPEQTLRRLMPLVDDFLVDYKATDDELCSTVGGVTQDLTLRSIAILNESGSHIHLRCPIIPGVNDDDAHFDAIKALRAMYPSIRSTEIMAYHDIGKTKWKALGMDYSFPDLPSASPEQKRKWEKKVEIE